MTLTLTLTVSGIFELLRCHNEHSTAVLVVFFLGNKTMIKIVIIRPVSEFGPEFLTFVEI